MENITQQLKSTLKSNNNKDDWQEFIKIIKQQAPFLIGSGAPTKKEIHDSFIGQLGYSTWRDFCTTELKLTQSTWHAWTKADKVVQSNSYIATLNLSASQINTMKSKCNTLPTSNIEYQKYKHIKSSARIASNELKRIKSASVFKRLIWLFTGVK